MKPARAIRVLLVDDHALVVELLRRWIDRDPSMWAVGAAASLHELNRLRVPSVDVVLMDYLLPDGNGVEGTRIAKRRWPRARVVMLTGWDDESVMLQAIQAGADGYLLKDKPPDDVVEAVRVAHRGGVLLPPEVLDRVHRETAAAAAAAAVAAATDRPRAAPGVLTRRETQVLAQLIAGVPTDEIAARLSITPSTTRTHVRNLLRKLGVHSKLAAVAFAVGHDLVPSSR